MRNYFHIEKTKRQSAWFFNFVINFTRHKVAVLYIKLINYELPKIVH